MPWPPKLVILISLIFPLFNLLVSNYYVLNAVLVCRDIMANRQQCSYLHGMYSVMREMGRGIIIEC